MVPKKTSGPVFNGSSKKEHTMSYQKDGKGAKASNGHSAGFRTDSAISSGRPGTERTLQRWMPDDNDTFGQSLESSSGGTWDQFAENERRFGIRTDYDENIYTTSIDRSHPHYKDRMAAADRKAREIERSAASTSHVAEERIMDFVGRDDKEDEEDKYSGVRRQDFPPLGANRENKYTPPARRAPTGASNVKGAPIDPAIISSQLKTQKPPSTKPDETKSVKTESSTPAATAKPDVKTESLQKPADPKSLSQSTTPLKTVAPGLPASSPQPKEDATTSNATSTVEHDVLKEFKSFAAQQRQTAEKSRSNRAKADKEVKLTELRKFATSFKLPTPVPKDLIGIIAKDPARQKEIQQKAQKDAEEVAKKKSDDLAKEKKDPTKETPSTTPSQTPTESKAPSRPNAGAQGAPSTGAARSGSHQQNNRGNVWTGNNYTGQYMPNRPSSHVPQSSRPTTGLAARIRNQDKHNGPAAGQDMRIPPTGPANSNDTRRLGGPHAQPPMSAKLNPNSHEFRPNPFATSFNPAGASKPPSPRVGHTANEAAPATTASPVKLVVITKKRGRAERKKNSIMSHVRTLKPPENKNWNENEHLRPAYDTPPTWRAVADDEKPESTMHQSYEEYLDRHPSTTQPTPNPTHVMPQMAHQHQLPFHLQHGAQAHRQTPHAPHVGMQGNQHVPMPHGPFNGGDDHHRMMPSNSAQSFSSPRMAQVPMAYNSAQMPYNPAMNNFMPGQPQMGQFSRSFSNNGPYNMPQQPGAQMMPPGQFMMAMPGPMSMYQGHPGFVPPGTAPPPAMPGGTSYPSHPSPSRAAPMMVHQGSQQGQPPMYGVSPGIQYAQPSFAPQQQGPMNMRYNQGPHQYSTNPSQAHHHGPQHRNGNFNKNHQNQNQQQSQQASAPGPVATQGRSGEGSNETK